jgi:hypothetical protein
MGFSLEIVKGDKGHLVIASTNISCDSTNISRDSTNKLSIQSINQSFNLSHPLFNRVL